MPMRTALIMQSSCTVPGKETSTFAQLQTINQQHIPADRLLLSLRKIIGQCLIFSFLKNKFLDQLNYSPWADATARRCPTGRAGEIDRQMLQPAEVTGGQAVPL